MSSRRMLYPYHIKAKFALFPHRFMWEKDWRFKYTCIAAILVLPIMFKLQSGINSPGNVKRWEATVAKNEAEHQKHVAHMF